MEQRLIDANALKKAFCNHCDGDEPCTGPCVDIGLIETAPTVDAVKVVRCKDCVKRPPATARNGDEPTSDCPLWCGYCFGINDNYGGEFFCGVGARE